MPCNAAMLINYFELLHSRDRPLLESIKCGHQQAISITTFEVVQFGNTDKLGRFLKNIRFIGNKKYLK